MGWQDIAAMAVVVSAGVYLGRRSWLALAARRQAGCGSGCSTCDASRGEADGRLVSLEAPGVDKRGKAAANGDAGHGDVS